MSHQTCQFAAVYYLFSEHPFLCHGQNMGCFPTKGDGHQSLIGISGYVWCIPSGNLTVCYWKLPFIVSFPIENGNFP